MGPTEQSEVRKQQKKRNIIWLTGSLCSVEILARRQTCSPIAGFAGQHKAFGSTHYSRYQLEETLNFHHVISGNESVHASAKDLSLDIDKFGNMVIVSYDPKSSEQGEQIGGGFYLL